MSARPAYRLVAVSAGLSQPSSTRLLVDRLLASAVEHLGGRTGEGEVDVTVLELRDLAHDVVDRLLAGFASPRLQVALDAVAGADAVIAVSPTFNASYSGLFKSFLDVLGDGALAGTPVVLGATGGTARHSLALDFALRPLLVHLRAAVAPTAVFAASEDFGSAGPDGALSSRVERAAAELAAMVRPRGDDEDGPRASRPRSGSDVFDPDDPDYADFGRLLHGPGPS